jgi:hypothetical protein
LVGFAAGCVAMFGSLALLHAEAVRPGRAEPSPSPIAPSMDTTAALLEHVPPEIRESCQSRNLRAEATNDSVYASVVCQQQIQGDTVPVQYMFVHDQIALDDLFRAQLVHNDIQQAPSTGAAGSCGSSRPSAGAFKWYGETDEMTGHVDHVFMRPSKGPITEGSAACYIDADGVAWLDWIDFDTHIYAFTSTSIEHYGALFQWWLDQAGPFHPRQGSMPGNTVPSSASPTMGPQM